MVTFWGWGTTAHMVGAFLNGLYTVYLEGAMFLGTFGGWGYTAHMVGVFLKVLLSFYMGGEALFIYLAGVVFFGIYWGWGVFFIWFGLGGEHALPDLGYYALPVLFLLVILSYFFYLFKSCFSCPIILPFLVRLLSLFSLSPISFHSL